MSEVNESMKNGSGLAPRIQVRPFQERDYAAVRALYLEAILHSRNSPARFALRRHLTNTPGVTFFSIFVVSIFFLFSSSTRYAGLALLPVAPALLIVWRSKVWNGWYTYCQSAMLDDMADIATYYGTHPNGFWVAETEVVSTGSSKTIVGCIGLDSTTSSEPGVAELRRMAVNPACQGKGIGSMLLRTLVEHAKEEGLKEIFLDTSSYHWTARKLYEKHGFKEILRRVQRISRGSLTIHHMIVTPPKESSLEDGAGSSGAVPWSVASKPNLDRISALKQIGDCNVAWVLPVGPTIYSVGAGARAPLFIACRNFKDYYSLLSSVITKHRLDGIDLDIEEGDSLSSIEQIIKQLKADFGPDFIVTLAPVAYAMKGNIDPFSGIKYSDLETAFGYLIDWYNVQFYSGFGTMSTTQDYIDIVTDCPLDPCKLVAGTLTSTSSGSGYVDLDTVKSTMRQLLRIYGSRFGGIAAWEYYNSDPDTSEPWSWAALMKVTMMNWKDVLAAE